MAQGLSAWAHENLQEDESPSTLLDNGNMIVAQDADNYNTLINNMPRSESFKSTLKQLFASMLDASTYSNQQSISFCDYKAKIVTIENQIQANTSITTEERNLLLGCTSIARQSAYYHWQMINTDGGPVTASAIPPITRATWADIAGLAETGKVVDGVISSIIYMEVNKNTWFLWTAG